MSLNKKTCGEVMKDNQGNRYGCDVSTVYQFIMKKKKDYMSLRTRGVLRSILCITALLCTGWIYPSASEGASASTISEGDEWQYFKGVEEPPSTWSYLSYDASGWLKGRTGFGYGAGKFRTFLNDMKGAYQTVYARREFRINNPVTVKAMDLRIECDGPFAAYINGIEVIGNSEPVDEELDISGFADMLLSGRNVLAVQCTNDDLNSDKFSFTPLFRVYED
jgi:hypothetical protein